MYSTFSHIFQRRSIFFLWKWKLIITNMMSKSLPILTIKKIKCLIVKKCFFFHHLIAGCYNIFSNYLIAKPQAWESHISVEKSIIYVLSRTCWLWNYEILENFLPHIIFLFQNNYWWILLKNNCGWLT